MIVDRRALREAVLGKGLMDDAFYVANYGERIPPGEPAIDHYVRVGHDQGYAPCAAFDPVLHEVMHGPTPPSEWPDRAQAEAAPPPVAEIFPNLDLKVAFFSSRPGRELTENIREMIDNPTRAVELPTDVGVYNFHNPASSDLFATIEAGRPFSFVRIPHGFWDCSSALDRLTGELENDPRTRSLSDAHRRALAIRLLAVGSPDNGNFAGDYIDTILDDLRHHPRDPDLLTGIAFKGYPTYEDSAFGQGPPTPANLTRTKDFTQLFSPHDRLYDATVWKRWALLGGLRRLPQVLSGRPLILVAQAFFGVLAERLQLPQLVMVDVPGQKTQLIRRQVLARIEAAIEAQLDQAPDRPPVVLFQCGASIAYWFILRLRARFPQATYLDIGQALNIWCIDLTGERHLWVRIYYSRFSEACGTGRAGLALPDQA